MLTNEAYPVPLQFQILLAFYYINLEREMILQRVRLDMI